MIEGGPILDRFRLDSKVALVTGAGRGVGAGIAECFAGAGAAVVCAARTQSEIDGVVGRIRSAGGTALAVRCDVLDRADLEALVAAATEAFGRVDILVNNAGGGPYTPALRTGEAAFEWTLRFNVTSAFLLTRLCADTMLAGDGGVVLNISSALGQVVERGFVAYGTAKAALAHMTELLGYELAPRVRVNALALGSVETSALAPFLSEGDLRAQMIARTPMRRLGTVEDVASAALFLCSPAASWITAKVYEVDGGQPASNWPYALDDL